MIVVLVVGLLASIAGTNFINGRRTAQRNACISNLRQIHGAIQAWVVDTGAASNATFTTADICSNYLKAWPKEGTADYPVPADVSQMPTCPNSAIHTDHKL